MSFRLFGFDVSVHGSFFVMALVLGWPRDSSSYALAYAAC